MIERLHSLFALNDGYRHQSFRRQSDELFAFHRLFAKHIGESTAQIITRLRTFRHLMSGSACQPQHQLLIPQVKPEHEGATDEGTRALEEWMAEVTAHPERAIWSRDIERVLPSTTELYEMLPSDEGVPSSVSRPRGIAPPDSIQPMLFCSCCTPDTPAPRS